VVIFAGAEDQADVGAAEGDFGVEEKAELNRLKNVDENTTANSPTSDARASVMKRFFELPSLLLLLLPPLRGGVCNWDMKGNVPAT
jgi:hypothetical protein